MCHHGRDAAAATRSAYNRIEKELHERRRQRLEKITNDFPLWFNTPLPETDINFSEKGQVWMETS